MNYVRVTFFGTVQGVGFRPRVCKVASDLGIAGGVRNLGNCVEVFFKNEQECKKFLESFLKTLPPKAEIIHLSISTQASLASRSDSMQSLEEQSLQSLDFKNFKILPSGRLNFSFGSSIPRDYKICEACLEDFKTHSRYKDYGFVACSDCGPRYSILRSLPYDRENTSMSDFIMCEECQEEYSCMNSRRFHAQPMSCNQCAIPIRYIRANLQEVYGNEDAIQACREDLKKNKILAFKGVGGFALICKAEIESIYRLRKIKARPHKPFAMMVRDIVSAHRYAHLNSEEIAQLQSKFAPICLLKKKYPPKNFPFSIESTDNLSQEELLLSTLSQALAPNLARIGVVLPYSPLHLLLFHGLDFDIVFTSANDNSEPMIRDFAEMKTHLGVMCDGILDYDRMIENPVDDSVIQVISRQDFFQENIEDNQTSNLCAQKKDWINIIRLSRGYAPTHFSLQDGEYDLTVGMGGEERCSVAYAKGNDIILSPYIGNLSNPKTLSQYEITARSLENFYGLFMNTMPFNFKNQDEKFQGILRTDLHPAYHSYDIGAKKATQQGLKWEKIQHHKAHFASIYVDAIQQNQNLKIHNKALGVIWDGLGLGEDGKIWGGEFFWGAPLADMREVKLIGHFRPMRLLGGEKSSKHSYKSLFSLLLSPGFLDFKPAVFLRDQLELKYPDLAFLRKFECINRKELYFESRAVGRFFDILGCICCLCDTQSYDAQAALMMECYFDPNKLHSPFPYKMEDFEVDLEPMWKEVLILRFECDMHSKQRVREFRTQVITRFIHTLTSILLDFIKHAYNQLNLSSSPIPVMFSGGVFNNHSLCMHILKILYSRGWILGIRDDAEVLVDVYFHQFSPCNDGGLALGQVAARLL